MSFYTNNTNCICCPGPINGNPINGLCERVCIQTTKVFDSCMKQILIQNEQLTVTYSGTPTEPLTFISAENTPNTSTTITNLVVNRLVDRPCYARVSGNLNIPTTVTFTDNVGVTGTGTGTVVVPFDVILFVPEPSIVPYTIQGFGSVSSNIGSYTSSHLFTLDICLTMIIRVVVLAEICVPSYGYCQIPPCAEFETDQCSAVFDLPVFPLSPNN